MRNRIMNALTIAILLGLSSNAMATVTYKTTLSNDERMAKLEVTETETLGVLYRFYSDLNVPEANNGDLYKKQFRLSNDQLEINCEWKKATGPQLTRTNCVFTIISGVDNSNGYSTTGRISPIGDGTIANLFALGAKATAEMRPLLYVGAGNIQSTYYQFADGGLISFLIMPGNIVSFGFSVDR